MPVKYSKTDTLPQAIKDELTLKFLKRERYDDISQWLSDKHGLIIKRSALHVAGKAQQEKYAPLLALGMPAVEIAKHRALIDALGVEEVEQDLIAKLMQKHGDIFAYLDKEVER